MFFKFQKILRPFLLFFLLFMIIKFPFTTIQFSYNAQFSFVLSFAQVDKLQIYINEQQITITAPLMLARTCGAGGRLLFLFPFYRFVISILSLRYCTRNTIRLNNYRYMYRRFKIKNKNES